ncbi:MAG: hypothetical protein LBG18_09020 [Mediterranea sp.]|nr:hypothetical protein [Mediterranea sp.]
MKEQTNHRIFLAWLFAVILSIPSTTRVIHIYQNECEEEVCSHSDEHKHHATHDCNTCLLCNFVLSAFTEVRLSASEIIQFVFHRPEFILHQEKGFGSVVSSHQLRAPPVV